jgi:purine catabolism regulator
MGLALRHTRDVAAFTLGDLLALDLGLTLVAGGDDALARPVAGAHSIELEQPAAWLDRDWIMLTTGLRLRRRAAVQRALVADLVEAGAAGIGFGVGLVYERVPSALLDEARRRGLPVVAVPLETAFRDVVRAIHRAQSRTDALELQRLSAMQLQLMDALGDPRPRAAVVARLAELLNATVVLLSSAGSVLERAGDEPAEGVWEALAARHGPLAETHAGDRHVVAVPVAAGLGPAGWLAVVSRRARPAGRLTRPAARAAAPLLAALSRIDEAADRQERAVRRGLMSELLEPPAGRDAELRARAAELGVSLGDATRVVVLERATSGSEGGAPAGADGGARARADGGGRAGVDGGTRVGIDGGTRAGVDGGARAGVDDGGRAGADGGARAGVDGGTGARADLLGAWEGELARVGAPSLAVERGSRQIAALVPWARADVRDAVAAVVAATGCAGGVGRPTGAEVAGVGRSLRDARLALRAAVAGGDRSLVAFDELDLASFVAGSAPAADAEPMARALLAPLRDVPHLRETLVTWFAHDGDVGRTAAALCLRENSVRYRLGRIEDLLGRPLRSPRTIASLHVALALTDAAD